MSHASTSAVSAAPPPPAGAGASSRVLLALGGLFFGLVAAAWAWFHVGVRPPKDAIRFIPRTELPGWRFEPEAVPPKAQDSLATTNLFNGTFTGPAQERVMVFAAAWHASDARQLSVVQHTPDICWVGAGWVPMRGAFPDSILLTVGGCTLPFESRIFATPSGERREVVLWCTLISGRPAEEGRRFDSELTDADRRERHIAAARRLGVSQFIEGLSVRRAATGDKQFVRLSVPYEGDFEKARQMLEDFAARWLDVAPLIPYQGT